MASRDGGFIAAGYNAALDERAGAQGRKPSLDRGPPAALRPRGGNRDVEDQAQQGHWLSQSKCRRGVPTNDDGALEREFHPSPDHGKCGAFLDRRTGRTRARNRFRRGPRPALELELFRTWQARSARAPMRSPERPVPWPSSMSRRPMPHSPPSAASCAPRSMTVTLSRLWAGAIRGRAALAARSEGTFVANDCDPRARPPAVARDRPEHGRQKHLSAPERVDRCAGPDGRLRARGTGPHRRARRLFSRVGAADDLARGRSTFMVEMVETSAILNQTTSRSLVILDEIGRGTATFDGLSIAWAAVEHLHEVTRCAPWSQPTTTK